MTLGRLNPEGPARVIDRNDDSGARDIGAAVLGQRGLFLDVLIDAMRASGITTWRADFDEPADLLADLTAQSTDPVIIHLGAAGYTEKARQLIRRLAGHQILAIVLDWTASPAAGCSWVEAGAIWAVNPMSASIDELASAIRAASGQRGAAKRERRRFALAMQAWAASVGTAETSESSILTMRRHGSTDEDAARRNGHASSIDGGPSRRHTGGDRGRQV